MYSIGQQVSWRGINRDYTGVIVGFFGPYAIARIDGTGKSMLLGEVPKKQKQWTTSGR